MKTIINRKVNIGTALLSALVLTASLLLPTANASLLLEVDLSVENTIAIKATEGASLISASGSDFTGVYLADFFGNNNLGSIGASLLSGDLVSANEASDLSPSLFHFSNDPGLNIFSSSTSSNLSFTEGAQAFIGSAAYSISASFYQHVLTSATQGKLFFPADDIGDINNASVLGTWEVTNYNATAVSEPATLGLLALGLVGACLIRRRLV